MRDTALAITWRPTDHDLQRLQQLYPLLLSLYAGVSIATPPGDTTELESFASQNSGIKIHVGSQARENRRYQTILQALKFSEAQFIHYCDGDHAISRMEAHLDDWKNSLMAMRGCDCLIIGRSEDVFESYPPALKDTERLINMVASHYLEMPVDLGSGSRGFSRRAVDYLINHTSPETHALATDSQWPILLHKAGFTVQTYESAGAYYAVYGDEHHQRLHSVDQWRKRVKVAHLIVQAAIDTQNI